jgi:hypothetical protein
MDFIIEQLITFWQFTLVVLIILGYVYEPIDKKIGYNRIFL